MDVPPDAVVRRLEMAEDGAERDADGQSPPGDPGKLALARCKLPRDPLLDEKRLVTAVG